MKRRIRIDADHWILALTAVLSGVAGVVGSYAAVGFTRAFVASPIESFLTRVMPDVIVRYAITVLGHLGQRLNLVFALGLGVALLGVLSGIAILAGRRLDSALASVALAGVLCGLAVAMLVGTSVSAIGAGIGAGIVVGVAALASATTLGERSVSGQRRRALGSIASAFGIAIGGYLIGHNQVEDSAGGDDGESLQSLEGVGGDADGNGTATDGQPTGETGNIATDSTESTGESNRGASTSDVGEADPDAPTSEPAREGDTSAGEADTDDSASDVSEPGTGDSDTETASSGDATEESGTEAGGETEAAASERTAVGTTSGTETSVEPTIEAMLAAAKERSLDVANLDGLVSDGFYEVDISNVNPNVNPDDWALTVTGAVEKERMFSYDDLTSIPAENRFVSLRCVSDGLNGNKMDTALWTGIPVMKLLGKAGLPEECCVRLRAADDYYQVFPLDALRNGFLAYGMNNKLLPRGHGAPVRVLIPGHWGEINVKWLSEIEVLEQDAEGYWEKKGWHGTGPVNTVAKFHATNRLGDGRIQVGGHAYAGTRGVQAVEVSTDGGDSWNDATLSERLPPGTGERERGSDHAEDAWRQWEYTYDSPGSSHEVIVRATDGEGDRQPKEREDAYPSGPTGWVSKTIDG